MSRRQTFEQEAAPSHLDQTLIEVPSVTETSTSSIIIDSSPYDNFNVNVVAKDPVNQLQSPASNNCSYEHETIAINQSCDGSKNILPLGTSQNLSGTLNNSDQIVGRTRKKQHEATIDITTAQPGDHSRKTSLSGKADSWRFNDRSSEENVLPESSLGKIIIESAHKSASTGTGAVAVATQDVAIGRLNESITKFKDNSRAANLIQISDKASHPFSPEQSIAQLAQKTTSPHSTSTTPGSTNPNDSKRFRLKSLLDTVAASSPTTLSPPITTTCDSSSGELNGSPSPTSSELISVRDSNANRNQEEILLETLHEDPREDEYRSDDDDQDDNEQTTQRIGQFESYTRFNARKTGSSFRKSTSRLIGGLTFIRIQRLIGFFNFNLIDNHKETPYTPYEGRDLLTGKKKHSTASGSGKTFRGSYKYSRAEISMAIFKKLINLLFQKSTLALIGAFLIHITLGTVYTLSNINSYLTSYMRLHGSPTVTYGGSMWISSFYAIGQGFSMVLGGYLEKRFSARLACFLGCIIHSGSIMSTSFAVNYGFIAVLMSYGFLPGFGCGLAYMTPMSNGFGWYPNRRGLVAGVILAGFGIGTFVFNIAQTAYVNPDNLSPPQDASGYFTQDSVLTKVPGLFLFIGSIYAAMQFVGCCLLFKPPQDHLSGKSQDERPILETEMSVARAIRTREFAVLFVVYGIITQGVLFVNSMIKEYGQLFIGDDMYLAWTGSMASIANALGRLGWGLAIDRYSFSQCFTCITSIFGLLMFMMPFEFVLSSKQLYLICTLGIFGSFSGWMSTFPVHLSRTFGRLNAGMLYGLIFISQVSISWGWPAYADVAAILLLYCLLSNSKIECRYQHEY